MNRMEKHESKPNARSKLLNAALTLIREKGYGATTVDELCAAAKVTKGAFFHHFKSKEDLAVAAAQHWSTITTQFFQSAPYQKIEDPLERLLGYIDFRRDIIQGDLAEFTCLVGTMVQEAYESNPSIREACQKSIFGHSADVARDIEAAKRKYVPNAEWDSKSLALHTQAVIQGSFILAKSDQNAAIAADSITHLRRYLEFLFKKEKSQ